MSTREPFLLWEGQSHTGKRLCVGGFYAFGSDEPQYSFQIETDSGEWDYASRVWPIFFPEICHAYLAAAKHGEPAKHFIVLADDNRRIVAVWSTSAHRHHFAVETRTRRDAMGQLSWQIADDVNPFLTWICRALMEAKRL